jgi:heme/copper-type cytochrome/quinol oxidase subunit 4
VSTDPGIFDFKTPPSDHKYKFSVEPNEATADRNVRLFKDVVVFLLAVGFVLLIVWLCITTVVSSSAQAEEKKWAMSILSAAAGGLIGYLIRK